MLPEFIALTIYTERLPIKDALTRDLRTAFKTKKISLYLLFTTQLYLDIHNRLRDQVDRDFSQLTKVVSSTRHTIHSTLDFQGDLRSES